jgi:hypothetical protein
MPYLHEGVEYLLPDEVKVYEAVKYLNGQNRTTNNSQVAWAASLGKTKVSQITAWLRGRGYLVDKGKGAAYHWRTTDKKVIPWNGS